MVNSPERRGGDLPMVLDAHLNGNASSTINGHANGHGAAPVADGAGPDGAPTQNSAGGPAAIARRLDAMEYEGDEGFVPLWKGSNLDRREFVRLAMQTFEDMGYTSVLMCSRSWTAPCAIY